MNLDEYKKVQSAAKEVHAQLGRFISSESSEQLISNKAIELMASMGITDTWYHGIPAFVLLGSRSCLSVSGRDYTPSNELVGMTNMVTVDLSPMLGDVWGDCARSYYIEEGICSEQPKKAEFSEGKAVEKELHQIMSEFVTPTVTFSELFEFGNQKIRELGYENLDFLGNLGHSIETDPDHRKFIDSACHDQLGAVNLFTFEPHIRKVNGKWGFKHENIYFFDQNGCITEL
ncbi:M24 family metallopeptidase [Aliamphritea ceti]|uniref:M24 family metallopeptidase n=1 Tax=Aliamphritea ceti TaxID=1524258 RepID=UPI0021C36297|nr:M24 family metallopeptidase [Aliamphritea ceti]